MKKVLMLAAALSLLAIPAKADLVLSQLVFADLGATGFGNAPRLLTLQTNVLESGGTVAGVNGATILTGDAISGADKSKVYSLAAIGWTSGALVGVGLDTNEIGSTIGLTFNSLVLTIYNAAGTPLGSFSGDGPVFISQALLALQQGNGNSVFNIGLDATEQAQFDTLIGANSPSSLFAGLSASFGCVTPAVGCGPSSDGADSFLAFQQTVAVPGPIVGAGIPGIIAAVGAMWALHRRRRMSIA